MQRKFSIRDLLENKIGMLMGHAWRIGRVSGRKSMVGWVQVKDDTKYNRVIK